MASLSVRFFPSAAVLISVLLLSGCDDGSSSSGCDALDTLVTANQDPVDGTTDSQSAESTPETQSLDLTSNEPEEAPAQTASAPVPTAQAPTTSNQKERGDFDLTLKQSYMPCPDCGLWFDSIELVIVHSQGTFSKTRGKMHVKKAPNRVGHFKVDISSIPRDAQIIRATLNMLLNRDEGIANGDNSSVIDVTGVVNGRSTFVRKISAAHDIKGKGYSKANPMVPIDFTEYARQL